MDTNKKVCEPCAVGGEKMGEREIRLRLLALPGWKTIHNHHIYKAFQFPDFKTALEFVNKIGAISEEEGHHPDLGLSYGKVEVTLYTHALDGLSENDFLLAEMIEGIQKH